MEKYRLVFLFILVAMTTASQVDDLDHPSRESESDSESEESTESPATPTNEDTTPDANKSIFINAVHNLASNISRNLIIHDNKVVWSPFVVVNALALLGDGNKELLNGFDSAWKYLTHEKPINSTPISIGYTKIPELLLKNHTHLPLRPLDPSQNVNALLQEAFWNITHFPGSNHSNQTVQNSTASATGTATEPPPLNATDTVLLTGLGVESLWATPFHPRYAKKSDFYLNSTHTVKARLMNNIGFYKYAELEGLDAVGVALPMKESPKTYMIFIKPNNPDDLELLNSKFENISNFTQIFSTFKTRRVQVGLPRVEIESQFPIILPNITTGNSTTTTSTLHISSLLVTYTGVYNNFHTPTSPRTRPLRFTRLRRRPDDARFKLNSPFLFHLYDDNFGGFLLSGLVLNPVDYANGNPDNAPPFISPEIKIAMETANTECMEEFQKLRKTSGIYDNLHVNCASGNANYSEILRSHDNNFTLLVEKGIVEKKFWRNYVDFVNVSMGEVVKKVRYGSFGDLFDGRVLKVGVAEATSIYLFYPNSKSGLSKIEETMETTQLNVLNCQMRDLTVRLRLPSVNSDGLSIGFSKIPKKKKNVAELVEIERKGRKSSPKRYRQLTIDRSFMYLIVDNLKSGGGGVVGVGRVVVPVVGGV